MEQFSPTRIVSNDTYMLSTNHKLVSLHVMTATFLKSVKYEPLLTAGVNGAIILLVGKRYAAETYG